MTVRSIDPVVGGHVEMDPPANAVTIRAWAGDGIVFGPFRPNAAAVNVTAETQLASAAEFPPRCVAGASVPPPNLVAAPP